MRSGGVNPWNVILEIDPEPKGDKIDPQPWNNIIDTDPIG